MLYGLRSRSAWPYTRLTRWLLLGRCSWHSSSSGAEDQLGHACGVHLYVGPGQAVSTNLLRARTGWRRPRALEEGAACVGSAGRRVRRLQRRGVCPSNEELPTVDRRICHTGAHDSTRQGCHPASRNRRARGLLVVLGAVGCAAENGAEAKDGSVEARGSRLRESEAASAWSWPERALRPGPDPGGVRCAAFAVPTRGALCSISRSTTPPWGPLPGSARARTMPWKARSGALRWRRCWRGAARRGFGRSWASSSATPSAGA